MSNFTIVSLNQPLNTFTDRSTIKRELNGSTGDRTSTSDEDVSDTETVSSFKENGLEVKRKRQRLTHLTPEEKLMRRKLKNRVAAQSARDRKKVKVDDLEITCVELKKQNEKLLKENTILKEKAQLLIDENRKLLKFKSDAEKAKPQVVTLVKSQELKNTNTKNEVSTVACVQSIPVFKLNPVNVLGDDKSAVFIKYVSQPKKHLQGSFQRMIYMLILQTLGLLKQEMLNSSLIGPELAQSRITKLKLTLEKLYKLAQRSKRTLLPKPQESIRIMNTYKKMEAKRVQMSSTNLAVLISVMVQAMEMKKRQNLRMKISTCSRNF
jgi:hypothetical protein